MEVHVQGPGPTMPFLSARDRFETEHDLSLPVKVQLRDDPDERTWAGHYDDRHVLNISRQAASSAMAPELVLHEFAHMARYEQNHPSHTQSTEEALYLGLAGNSVERRKLTHCYQIANHMKDIYADDITLSVGSGEKLLAFLESSLASALANRPGTPPRSRSNGELDAVDRSEDAQTTCDAASEEPATRGRRRISPAADPDITAVNAAFALALVERHALVDDDHRLYDLAQAAAMDAPAIPIDRFTALFRELADDPSESEYRKALVDVTRTYALERPAGAD